MSGSPVNQGLSILIRLKGEWSMEENHFEKSYQTFGNPHKSG